MSKRREHVCTAGDRLAVFDDGAVWLLFEHDAKDLMATWAAVRLELRRRRKVRPHDGFRRRVAKGGEVVIDGSVRPVAEQAAPVLQGANA